MMQSGSTENENPSLLSANHPSSDWSCLRTPTEQQQCLQWMPWLQQQQNERRELPKNRSSSDMTSEQLIAESLTQLSAQEREAVSMAVHGVEPKQNRSPEELQAGLNNMRNELNAFGSNRRDELGDTLRLAVAKDVSYVMDDEPFWIHFLATEKFDVPAATLRFVWYLHSKRTLFGEDYVCKQITFDDLTPVEHDIVHAGYFQILSRRDRCNRAVSVSFIGREISKYSGRSLARAAFWTYDIYASVLEPHDCSYENNVSISFCESVNGTMALPDNDLPLLMSMMSKGLPYAIATQHICLTPDSSPLFRGFLAFTMKAVDFKNRARFRMHVASFTECQYILMTYGVEDLPITSDGKLKTKQHLELTAMFRRREQQALQKLANQKSQQHPSNPTAKLDRSTRQDVLPFQVRLPLNTDVLSGRGRPYASHMGNIALAQKLKAYTDQYSKLWKGAKPDFVDGILQDFQKQGVRFLAKEDGLWKALSHYEARERISAILRTKVRKRPRA